MSPARTPQTPPAVEAAAALAVTAEPAPLPASVPAAVTLADVAAAMAESVRIARDLQPHLLVMSETHEDPAVAALAGAVFSLATCVEALAKANA